MSINQYTVEWNDASVMIEIDDEKCTNELLHEINNFWSNAHWRLGQSNGNVLHAVLKMLARLALLDSFDYDVIRRYKCNSPEGFPELDGSYGIKILEICEIDVDTDDMYVIEISNSD